MIGVNYSRRAPSTGRPRIRTEKRCHRNRVQIATDLMRVVPAGAAGVLVNIVVVEVGVLGQ